MGFIQKSLKNNLKTKVVEQKVAEQKDPEVDSDYEKLME